MKNILFLFILSFSLLAEEPRLSLDEASIYCVSINKRLPSRDELDQIIKSNGIEKSYWSSSSGGKNGAWIVSSGKNRYLYQTKNNIHYVKCL